LFRSSLSALQARHGSTIDPAQARENERILARVEELGGGYVWDAGVFAVTLMDVALSDADALPLASLVGVQQIALDCAQLSAPTLQRIAAAPGLQSLVICNHGLTGSEIEALRSLGPEVKVLGE